MGVPKLRFKVDDGSNFPDWESTTVGELFTFVTEKNKSGRISDVITNSAEHGLIPQREYFDKDIAVEGNTEGYTVIHKGDFVYNPRKSTIAPFGPFNIYEQDEVGIVSPLYTCLTPRDGETAPYLSWYFKTSRWHRYIVTHGAQGGARHDRVGMTNALMKGIPVMLPSLPEQRKIADLLSAVDDAITAQKAEVAAWEKRKKGVIQKLFSQEIRFKADDGSDFPDWEEKTLGDICMYERQRSEGANFVGTENMLKDFGGVTFDNSNADSSGTLYHPGDTLMSNIRPYLKKAWLADCKGTCSTDVLVFHPTSVEPGYLYWLIASDAFVRYVMSAAKGLKMPRGDKKHIMEMPLLLPNKDEQRKIDDCLSSLNNVIIKAKNELAKWQELKKGLLQQMFV